MRLSILSLSNLLLLCVLGLTGTGTAAAAGSDIYGSGNSVYSNGGSSVEILESDAEDANDVNSKPAATPTVYRQLGSTTYGSDGATARQIGNTIHTTRPDGTPGKTCTKVGNNTFCN